MKVGETIAVNIGQATVQQAKIVEIDTENNLATLVIPATKVVMSYRTELDTTPVTPNSGKEHAILGLENESTPDAPVNEAALAADAAAAAPGTSSTTSAASEQPEVAAVEVVAPTPVETTPAVPADGAPVVEAPPTNA